MLEILNGRDKFYQWDVNQKLIVDDNIIAVQYDNGTGDALVCGVYEYEGKRVADVPNIMLQTYWAIKCYAYCGECVRAEKVYEVEKRSRPDDYIYTETETLRYTTLFDMLTDLEAKHNEEVAAIEADVAANSERISTNKVNIDVLTKNVDVWRDNEIERHNQQQQQINKNKSDIESLNAEYDAKINSLIDETNAGFANVYSEDEKIRQTLRYHDSQLTSQYERINDNNSTLINHENRITTLENNPTGGGGSGTASDVDWNESNPESPAYIKNRTHYVKDWGTYRLDDDNKNGLVSFDISKQTIMILPAGTLAYKVSDVIMPDEAIRQVVFSGIKSDGKKTVMLTAATTGSTYYTIRNYSNGGLFVVSNVEETNSRTGLEVKEPGTYMYKTGTYIGVEADYSNTVYKLDNKYLDLSQYYTRTQIDSNYYDKDEVNKKINDAVANIESNIPTTSTPMVAAYDMGGEIIQEEVIPIEILIEAYGEFAFFNIMVVVLNAETGAANIYNVVKINMGDMENPVIYFGDGMGDYIKMVASGVITYCELSEVKA